MGPALRACFASSPHSRLPHRHWQSSWQQKRQIQPVGRGTIRCPATQLLSPQLLALSCKATFKLGCIGAFAVWLMQRGRLPADTPSVLSKVAFNICIPCMLLTKTAETLARTAGDWRYLMVPVATVLQVCIAHHCLRT